MIGFYVLLILGIIIFIFINIYAFSFGLLTSISSLIFFELIFLWVCIGPQIVLYYIIKLKKSINSYQYLYEIYEELKEERNELKFINSNSEKDFNSKIKNLEDVSDGVIERQRRTIQELTKQRDRYKSEYIYLKRKFLEETDRKDG